MADHIYLDPEISQLLALKKLHSAEPSPLESLSRRELDIVLKITQGLDLETIAKKLCISPKTLHTYRYNIHKKLHINNDVELIWLLKDSGLFNLN